MMTSRDSVAAAVLLFLSGLHKLEPLVLISLERLVGVARVLVASQDLVNTSAAIVHHCTEHIGLEEALAQYNYSPQFLHDNKS